MNLPRDFMILTGAYVTASVILSLLRHLWRSKRLRLPPSPKSLPIVGHLWSLPPTEQWKRYHEWSRELGSDIIYLNFMGQHVIVLDSFEVASELLDKRSAIYSGRIRLPMGNELMGWNFNAAFMDYGSQWWEVVWKNWGDIIAYAPLTRCRRKQLRLIHGAFSPLAAKRFHPHILRSTRRLLSRFISDPEADIVHTVGIAAGETIMSIVYGLPPSSPLLDTSAGIDAVRLFVESVVPGTYLVDVFPILKQVPSWVPGADFQSVAARSRDLVRRMISAPFEEMKRRIDAGDKLDCFGGRLIDRLGHGGELSEDIIRNTCGSLVGAASETTVSVVSSCILGLLQHPKFIRRAQLQLDTVVPQGTLPSFEHQSQLPLITAITFEALRWRDIIPLAIPHKSAQDDEYMGYHIPKGTMVLANVWAMLHDESIYPDPFTFNPARFLHADGTLDDSVRSPAHACWGFGRRICPGRHVAFSSIWVTLASLLYCFNIEKARDDTGHEIEPFDDIAFGLTCLPKSYRSCLTPRSAAVPDLIYAAIEEEEN